MRSRQARSSWSDAAWRSGISGYSGGAGITYYANGMVSSVTHPNGVTAIYGLDPFGMPRPASITAPM